MVNLVVSSLKAANEIAHQFDAVISIESTNAKRHLQSCPLKPDAERLIVVIDDIDRPFPDKRIASIADVARVIALAADHIDKDILIHCEAGRSRSTALALSILARWYGPDREKDAVDHLLQISPKAAPNMRIIELADLILHHNGKLIHAIKSNQILRDRQKARQRLIDWINRRV